MAVPFTFGSATASIPLSQLDSNFATTITLGNTSIQLGNTVTTLNNMTLGNVTVSSVASTFPNNFLGNSSVTIGNTAVALGSTVTSFSGLTALNFASGTNGIVFNNTSALVNSTLNDYEVGTFTPTFAASSGAWTSYTSTGYYTKVGRVVTVLMGLNITNVGTGAGGINFSGLPFGTLNCTTYGGNRAAVGLFREDAVTGVAYQAFPNGNGGTSGQAQSLTGGAVVQATNYAYICSLTYQASF